MEAVGLTTNPRESYFSRYSMCCLYDFPHLTVCPALCPPDARAQMSIEFVERRWSVNLPFCVVARTIVSFIDNEGISR
jgi:hypothetical protein